jgi:hypothetical protein
VPNWGKIGEVGDDLFAWMMDERGQRRREDFQQKTQGREEIIRQAQMYGNEGYSESQIEERLAPLAQMYGDTNTDALGEFIETIGESSVMPDEMRLGRALSDIKMEMGPGQIEALLAGKGFDPHAPTGYAFPETMVGESLPSPLEHGLEAQEEMTDRLMQLEWDKARTGWTAKDNTNLVIDESTGAVKGLLNVMLPEVGQRQTIELPLPEGQTPYIPQDFAQGMQRMASMGTLTPNAAAALAIDSGLTQATAEGIAQQVADGGFTPQPATSDTGATIPGANLSLAETLGGGIAVPGTRSPATPEGSPPSAGQPLGRYVKGGPPAMPPLSTDFGVPVSPELLTQRHKGFPLRPYPADVTEQTPTTLGGVDLPDSSRLFTPRPPAIDPGTGGFRMTQDLLPEVGRGSMGPPAPPRLDWDWQPEAEKRQLRTPQLEGLVDLYRKVEEWAKLPGGELYALLSDNIKSVIQRLVTDALYKPAEGDTELWNEVFSTGRDRDSLGAGGTPFSRQEAPPPPTGTQRRGQAPGTLLGTAPVTPEQYKTQTLQGHFGGALKNAQSAWGDEDYFDHMQKAVLDAGGAQTPTDPTDDIHDLDQMAWAVMQQESSLGRNLGKVGARDEHGNLYDTQGRPRSSAGAIGAMQVTEAAGEDVGILGADELYKPSQNILAGVRYLAKMYRQFGDSWPLALSAYYGGPTALEDHLGPGGTVRSPRPETEEYVKEVLELLQTPLLQRRQVNGQ